MENRASRRLTTLNPVGRSSVRGPGHSLNDDGGLDGQARASLALPAHLDKVNMSRMFDGNKDKAAVDAGVFVAVLFGIMNSIIIVPVVYACVFCDAHANLIAMRTPI